MQVKMLAKISGTRNGAEWPAVNTVIDLPEAEAKDLIAAGQATDKIEGARDSEGNYRDVKPWESVGLADGDYPDATGRTGPALVDELGEVTDAGITVNGDHLEGAQEAEAAKPTVPDDARVDPPTTVNETVETKAGVGKKTTKKSE